MSVENRIREIASDNSLNLKEFSAALGVSYRTIQNYLAGERAVGGEFLSALTSQMGVSASWVLTGIGPKQISDEPIRAPVAPAFIPIPRLDVEASAGHGAEAGGEETTGHYAFNQKWITRRGLNANNLSVIAVKGDSMEPRIYDGDLVLIDHAQNTAIDGRIFVTRFDGHLFVKRLQLQPGEKLHLFSENTAYPPLTVSLKEDANIEIVGRVVASMHEW